MEERFAFFNSLAQKSRPLAGLSTFDDNQISLICEMMWNLWQGVVPLYKSSEYKLLILHRSSVEAIARAKQVIEARRLIALQGNQLVVPFLPAVVRFLRRHEEVQAHSGRSRAGQKA